MTQKLWFTRRSFGWGWRPASWEGWVIVLVFMGIILLLSLKENIILTRTNGPLWYILIIVVLVGVLLYLGHTKGEKPGWSWGK